MPYEKIGKNESVCIADEVPFEIPENWEWVRLGALFQHNTGKALNSSNHSGELLTYITTSNLYWNRFEIDNLREMYFSEAEIKNVLLLREIYLFVKAVILDELQYGHMVQILGYKITFIDYVPILRYV